MLDSHYFTAVKEAVLFSENNSSFQLSKEFITDLLTCKSFSFMTFVGETKAGKSYRLNTILNGIHQLKYPFRVITNSTSSKCAFYYTYISLNPL
jgi:hypothetical protein